MKALMVAIQPKWLKMILNGEKKFEFRNWKVPVGTVIYFYCTKAKPIIYDGYKEYIGHGDFKENCWTLNGKVVAKAVVKDVYEIGIANRPFYDKEKLRSWSKYETFTKEQQENMGIPFSEGFHSWMPISVDELTPLGYTNQTNALELSQVEEIEPKDVTEFVSWSKLTKRVGKSKQAVLKLENNEFDLDRFHYDIMNYGTLRGRCKLIHPPQSRTWIYVEEEL